MADNIELLGNHANDATMITPEQCLKDVLNNDLGKRGAFKHAKKIVVIALDESDGGYYMGFDQAGMSMSEVVALCECFKKFIITDMMEI